MRVVLKEGNGGRKEDCEEATTDKNYTGFCAQSSAPPASTVVFQIVILPRRGKVQPADLGMGVPKEDASAAARGSFMSLPLFSVISTLGLRIGIIRGVAWEEYLRLPVPAGASTWSTVVNEPDRGSLRVRGGGLCEYGFCEL